MLSALLIAPLGAEPTAYLMEGKTIPQLEKSRLIAEVAQDMGLAAEHLAWANGTSPTVELPQGSEVTLPGRLVPLDGPENGAWVNLAERGFYLFEGGDFKGFYPISVGMEKKASYHTPIGDYEIISRIKNPAWEAPDSDWAEAMDKDRIDADSEENPLGEYWFGIGQGYGFHENTAPLYTGDAVSHGCMRLYSEHAKELYQQKLLTEGDTVTIVNQPIRLSENPDGGYYLAIFPDLYYKGDQMELLRESLEEAGIKRLLPDEYLSQLVEDPSGKPEVILNDTAQVEFDGERLQPQEADVLLVGGTTLMPVRAAQELGLNVEYDGEEDRIIVSSEDKSQTFSLQEGAEYTAGRLGERTYLEADALLDYFGFPYSWNSENKALEIGRRS